MDTLRQAALDTIAEAESLGLVIDTITCTDTWITMNAHEREE